MIIGVEGERRADECQQHQQLQVEHSVEPEAEPSFPSFDDPT